MVVWTCLAAEAEEEETTKQLHPMLHTHPSSPCCCCCVLVIARSRPVTPQPHIYCHKETLRLLQRR